jgi:hypothetical protein
MACSGTEEDVRYFLEVVRFAAELERSWLGRPIQTDEPILKAPDVVQRLQFPAPGREALPTRLGLLLEVEWWGWQTASVGSPDWRFGLNRQVRRFRGVKDLRPVLVSPHPSERAAEPWAAGREEGEHGNSGQDLHQPRLG